MWLQLINVVYVLVAIAMVVLILMQRGAGAQAVASEERRRYNRPVTKRAGLATARAPAGAGRGGER